MEPNKAPITTHDGTVDLHGRPVLASKTGRWKACSFLVGYEAFERMSFYGIAASLVVYLTTELREDTVSSVRNVNNWSGSVWMTPILGAYIADSYLGRYWTFTISSVIYVSGMALLTLAVSLKSLKPTCLQNGPCNKASSSQTAFFYSCLYVIALGAGGTKPNISTFGADQFDDFDPNEIELKASFFNWWMFSSFLGALFATLGLVYIQENVGWGLGYGIPTVGLLLSLVIFYLGTPFYRHKASKSKSPTRRLVRVIVAAVRNSRWSLPAHTSDLHELDRHYYDSSGKRQVHHTPVFSFLDKAAIKGDADSSRPPCTVTQVEETKLVLGMLLIWLVTVIPSTIWAQINTLFIKQGTTMDRHLGPEIDIPAASLVSFVTLSMLLCVPVYDRLFVPLMRNRTGNPRGITLLQRLGIGFTIQVLAIAVAYLVEVRRIHVIRAHHITRPTEIVPMSIFWLLPQFVLLGVGDVFNAIGLLEFFYDQSPEDMQSLGTTFFTSGIGVGNFLNSLLVTLVDKFTGRGGRKSWIGNNLNDSHLDYYYGFLIIISTFNLVAFVWASSKYTYKREAKEEIISGGSIKLERKSSDKTTLSLQV